MIVEAEGLMGVKKKNQNLILLTKRVTTSISAIISIRHGVKGERSSRAFVAYSAAGFLPAKHLIG